MAPSRVRRGVPEPPKLISIRVVMDEVDPALREDLGEKGARGPLSARTTKPLCASRSPRSYRATGSSRTPSAPWVTNARSSLRGVASRRRGISVDLTGLHARVSFPQDRELVRRGEPASTRPLDELRIGHLLRRVALAIDSLPLASGSLQRTDRDPIARVLRYPNRLQSSPSSTVETATSPSHTSLAERAEPTVRSDNDDALTSYAGLVDGGEFVSISHSGLASATT